MSTSDPAIAEPAEPAALSHRQILVIFSGLMMGMLLAALDQTIVATALPTITGELGGLNHLSWVVTSYLLASSVSTPLYGKAGDLFGRKRLFQFAIVVFLVGSVLSGIAQSMTQLIVFRAVQGLGAGGLIVLALALIAEVVSPRERGRYQGYFGALFGASSIGGPLLGGFLTDQASWRWVFYVNIPIGLAALVVVALKVPSSPRQGKPSIDYLGSAVLTAAVTSVVLFTTWGGTEYAWGSATVIGLAVASLVLLAVLIVVERRVADPVLPVHLFRGRTFNISSAVSFVLGVAMYGAIAFLPLFLQVVNGASATNSGLLLVPLMLGLIGASMISGAVISRTGRYKIFPVAGSAIASVALFMMSTMGTDTARAVVTVYMVALGVGIGLCLQTMILAVQNAVQVAELGVATSAVSFFRSMGGSVGVALFGALFNNLLARKLGPEAAAGGRSSFTPAALARLPEADRVRFIADFADSLTTVFLYATPLMALAFLLTWLMHEVPLRESVEHGPADGAASAAEEGATPAAEGGGPSLAFD